MTANIESDSKVARTETEMTIKELRASLADKAARGVKQVRVSTMLGDLPKTVDEAFPNASDPRGRLRDEVRGLRERVRALERERKATVREENRELRDRVNTLERERRTAAREAAAQLARSEARLRERHAGELAAVRAGRNGKGGGTPLSGLESLAAMSEDDPKRYGDVDVKGVFVGTAEAAAMLGVERPRIGRWVSLGKLPPPIAELRATPVWLRSQIESKRSDVESRRKPRRESVEESVEA
jgi:hypothetical protein